MADGGLSSGAITTAVATAGLALSGVTLWVSLTNRTDDHISQIDSRLSSAEATLRSHDQRLSQDEAWVSWLIQRKNQK